MHRRRSGRKTRKYERIARTQKQKGTLEPCLHGIQSPFLILCESNEHRGEAESRRRSCYSRHVSVNEHRGEAESRRRSCYSRHVSVNEHRGEAESR